MQTLFKDILETDGVNGVMLFSFVGDILYQEFSSDSNKVPKVENWGLFVKSLDSIREVDLIFENGRLYVRKTDIGYLVILMGLFVPAAMVRLNCDIILPSLKQPKTGGGIRRFFKR